MFPCTCSCIQLADAYAMVIILCTEEVSSSLCMPVLNSLLQEMSGIYGASLASQAGKYHPL